MKFYAFSPDRNEYHFSFDGRDDDAGILGTIETSARPVADSNARDEIIEIAYAQIGRDPDKTFYITDADKRVLEILTCCKYHAAIDSEIKTQCMAWVTAVLFAVSLVLTILLGLGFEVLFVIVPVIFLYRMTVRSGFFNEIEAAIPSVLLLIFGLLLLPPLKTLIQLWIETPA